ncbi:MAG: tRNA dihydrouridine synthase DusB [Desulfuromonadales bacterium C00003096]|jgi:nifR3 family TIM-barrel protein|nr:MAG: tRNA dihydrouridine synthase DusB [Desulfuromonadales bacterium C00003096]
MHIGSLHLKNNILLAPLAGITDLPYRLIMRRYGIGLAFTEMVSANGLVRAGRNSEALLLSTEEDHPLGVQLFGDDPQVLAKAAVQVEDRGELIDLNLGCPVKKVIRSGAGSALLQDPAKIGKIVAAVRRAISCPLTVKLRSGWDSSSINYLEVGRIAEAEGADALILHPRTRSQAFSGRADWGHIARLKQAVTVPVIGSGDIASAEDASAMLTETGCDGVMLGRGCYGNPWLVSSILASREDLPCPAPGPLQCLEAVRSHFELFVCHFGEHKALFDMRKHLCWYSRGLPKAAAFRTLINGTRSFAELQQATEDFFLAAVDFVEN